MSYSKKQAKQERRNTFGWLDTAKLPKDFGLPTFVMDRVKWVMSYVWRHDPFKPMLTVSGAARLLLDYDCEEELKKDFLENFDNWKPFTKEYIDYLEELPYADLRQLRVLQAMMFS